MDALKTHQSLTLHWSPPPPDRIHGDLMGYNIKVSIYKTGVKEHNEPKVHLHSVHPSINSLTLNFLEPNSEYKFDIAAVNQHGAGASDIIFESMCIFVHSFCYSVGRLNSLYLCFSYILKHLWNGYLIE